jgi:hypothetical protein
MLATAGTPAIAGTPAPAGIPTIVGRGVDQLSRDTHMWGVDTFREPVSAEVLATAEALATAG